MCCNQQPPQLDSCTLKRNWLKIWLPLSFPRRLCIFSYTKTHVSIAFHAAADHILRPLSLYLYLRRWVKIHFVIILLCGSKVVLRCFMVSKWLGRRCKMHSSHTWALSNSSPHQICMTVFCWENSTATTKKMEWFGAHSPDIHSENGWKNEVPFRKICVFRVSVIRLVSVSFERIFGILSIKFIWCICILLDSEHP